MGRQPCCDKVGLKRGPWTIGEDHRLMNFILNNGIQCWRMVPKRAGLLRCGKSCRLRWINYLMPDLKRGAISEVEENQIIELHSRLGNRWSKIASHFPGRTDNEIKNHWNTRIKKRLKLLGIDPVPHKPYMDDYQQKEFKEEVQLEDINDTITTKSTSPTNDQHDEDQEEEILDVTHHHGYCDHDQIEGLMEAAVPKLESEAEATIATTETTYDALNKYEILCGISLDMEFLMNQETDAPNNSCDSPSLSLEDSLNPSTAEYSSSTQPQQDDSFKQWLHSVDCFNHLQEDFFLLDKS